MIIKDKNTKLSLHIKNNSGFTLIEITVVVFLISMMFFFAIPKFDNNIFSDDNRKVSNWILGNVRELKEQAVRKQKDYILHISIDSNTMWISSDLMGEDSENAEQKVYELPESIKLVDVEYTGNRKITFGKAEVFFYKKGYSDNVIIHIEENDEQILSFLIQPFITRVNQYKKYLEFEN